MVGVTSLLELGVRRVHQQKNMVQSKASDGGYLGISQFDIVTKKNYDADSVDWDVKLTHLRISATPPPPISDPPPSIVTLDYATRHSLSRVFDDVTAMYRYAHHHPTLLLLDLDRI